MKENVLSLVPSIKLFHTDLSSCLYLLQVFMTVVIFGLFHGLVYLPVILSWIGPAPYDTADSVHKVTENTAEDIKMDQRSSLLDASEDPSNSTPQINGFIKVSLNLYIIIIWCTEVPMNLLIKRCIVEIRKFKVVGTRGFTLNYQ